MLNTLIIDSINKSFGDKKVLSDIYLECKTGEIIGVLGRNGSGKTTLFKIIYGLEDAENKFIKLNGTVLNTEKLILNNISFLNQSSFIPISFSVKKSIHLSIEDSKLKEFYNDDNINLIRGKQISQISTGELRYLEVKIILFNISKFCLLDEPFSGLSPINIEKISNLITDNSKRKGIIISDHNYRQILKISSKVVLLKNGKTNSIKNFNELVEHNYILNL
jgi:ABC-type lipopolysaccharide export system ATPase subunit